MTRTVHARLDRLELQNRLLRATLGLGAIAVLSCGGLKANYERLQVNTLVVMDRDERAKITLSSDGRLVLHDPGGDVVLDAAKLRALVESTAPH